MRRTALIALCILFCSTAWAQGPVTGFPPFGSLESSGFDNINRQNLNVLFQIPIVSTPGRGLPFSPVLVYNSLIWAKAGSIWVPVVDQNGAPTWGWGRQKPVGTVTYQSQRYRCVAHDQTNQWKFYYHGYSFLDPQGTRHYFNVAFYVAELDELYPECSSGVRTGYATDKSGYYLDAPNVFAPSGSDVQVAAMTDTNGNYLTETVIDSSHTNWTDTLGRTALKIINNATNTQYQYQDSGGTWQTVTMYLTSKDVKTNFGCSGVTEYSWNGIYLPTSIALPDGTQYTFTYEDTPGFSGKVTGRIKRVTLPTGGYYEYSYGTTQDGISCTTANGTYLQRVVYDGTNTATRIYSATGTQTTVTDPTTAQNQSVFTFNSNGLPTAAKYYSGSATGTPLREVDTAYAANGTPSSVTTKLEDGTTQSQVALTYDSNGRLTYRGEYDYGGALVRQTAIAYASLGNNIIDRPSSVTVKKGDGTIVAQTTYTYDQGSVTPTTGTPQLNSVSGSRGNPTKIEYLVQGTTKLAKNYTYFDTGNVNSATDVNGAQTSNTYNGCASAPNSLLSSVSLPLSLSRSITWNCTGVVVTSSTDENNQTTSAQYNDPYLRPTQTTDQANYQTNISYSSTNGQPVWVESVLNFNGSGSTVDALATTDKLGRPRLGQRRQGQGAANLDSVETDYDVMGRASNVTLPYSAGAGVVSGATGTTATYDALSRPAQVTDLGGGTVSYSYTKNDVLQTVGPAPTGENTKRKQLEYDALGRLTSVCELTSTQNGGGTCGQTSSVTGYWTRYTYDVLGDLLTVSQNAQSASPQPRTYTYDGLGRMLSEANPETGTINYTYDADATCGTSNGDLVKRVDAVGNTTCYAYDALHRVTAITYPSGSYASATPEKHFVYDSATVNGNTMANAVGRLAEAYTGPSNNKTTDLGFSYTARGEIADVYEKTPNSGTYYNAHQTYWASGAPYQLSGLSGLPTITYGADAEGRPSTVGASSGQNPITSVSYNTASLPTAVTFGSSDSDSFSFDSNTFRMSQYQFTVNGSSNTGTLTWNSNGSLGSLAISDALNSSNSQTCGYSHDDLSRIASVSCGSTWAQTFSFDPFGNINKSGSISFAGSYSTSTNRLTNMSSSYDSNGNLTAISSDAAYGYSWDSEGKPVSITRSGSTVNLTYDALGRMVEQNRGGSYTQIVYGPGGRKLALMSGSSLQRAFVRLPAGAQAVYNGSGLAYYRHADWLGSSRLASTPSRTLYYDGAYAPYGESYSETGTTDRDFTGQNQDTHAGLYDFMYREYHPVSGRWSSPDPAGLAVVDLSNPQSWNRYVYALNNPLRFTDPLGLNVAADGTCTDDDFTVCVTDDGGGDDGGGDDGGSSGGCYDFVGCFDEPRPGPGSGPGSGVTPDPAPSAPKPANESTPNNPCAGRSAANLDYSASKQKIIDDHINGDPAKKSQYLFNDPVPLPMKFAAVQAFNSFTFKTGSFTQRSSLLIVVTTFVPPYLPLPVSTGGFVYAYPFIGFDKNSGGDTNFNTLVLQKNCSTVVTSHPGLPGGPSTP